jgi:hypothetical protein
VSTYFWFNRRVAGKNAKLNVTFLRVIQTYVKNAIFARPVKKGVGFKNPRTYKKMRFDVSYNLEFVK